MATFDLELVSPERLLLSRPVEMATIPAAEGEMGVLPGHAPMIVFALDARPGDEVVYACDGARNHWRLTRRLRA